MEAAATEVVVAMEVVVIPSFGDVLMVKDKEVIGYGTVV